MKLNEVIYINNLPSIDLHGLDRDTARVKVNEFIKDNITMKNNIICIVHGIGSGIIKTEVHNTLKRNKNVVDYKLFFNNIGTTIVELKVN
jgi:dsDNA-specific endonuclease/ATPase MutS2